ncbi:EAL domain-containing protein [Alkalimarinus coralli]|uniref:EAL domain-containing protein n=1 Tax=Alkalimarinus coralli TaxID=2935863 RepID=UPI00202B93BB|nr:EAL domain-containing protein [Alkalimarinus coralli]
MSSSQFTFKGVEISELLSRHGETCAWRAYDLNHDQPIIIKSAQSETPPLFLMERLRHEYEIGRHFKHPHIIAYRGLLQHHHRLAIVTEDFNGKPLAECIPEQGFPIGTFLDIALQIVKALIEIHAQQVIHKDLNPYNIVYNPQKRLAKIIDFGMASKLSQESPAYMKTTLLGGNLPYVAPEQTGRLNRVIDHRTDFYGLGITLYEMLCGQRPFNSPDPLELVHAHLTQPAPRLSEWRKDIPPLFDDILAKLLAKQSEDRYQSAKGIKHDLEKCLQQWQKTQQFERFEIGSYDRNEQLSIPQNLYGRSKEVARLTSAFETANTGLTELVLVSGFSGMGKTALVNETRKPLINRRGYFISGKFEPLKRNVPLSAITQSLQDLIQQLLTEPESRIAEYRQQIITALGDKASMLIELIPELETILGPQPPSPEMGSNERKLVFLRLLQRFIKVIAVKAHPLVMFIDDLQWADPISLDFVKSLLVDLHDCHLLLIGSYRDSEIYGGHPLIDTLKHIRQNTPHVQQIHLEPLKSSEVTRLICDTLQYSSQQAAQLSRYVFSRTQGNPFYVTQLLKTLNQDGQLYFDAEQREWCYELTDSLKKVTDHQLVDMVVSRINRLPADTKKLLQFAACIGSRFDTQSLTHIIASSEQGVSETDIKQRLAPAIESGLVISKSQWSDYDQRNICPISSYEFLHDRVQQAAYDLVPASTQQQNHLHIGYCLLAGLTEEQQQEQLFEIANQFNSGVDQLPDDERLPIAKLCLRAAQKARTATAFESAVFYAELSIRLLESSSPHINGHASNSDTKGNNGTRNKHDAWSEHHALRFEQGLVLAECEGLCRRFSQSEQRINELQQHANSVEEKIQLLLTQMNLVELRGQYAESIDVLLIGLALLDVNIPNSEQQQQQELSQLLQVLPSRFEDINAQSLIETSETQNPHHLLVMRLLMRLWTPCYITGQKSLLALVSIYLVNYSLKHGRNEITPFAYCSFALVYSFLKNDHCLAYQFGLAGAELAKECDNLVVRNRSYFLFSISINNWQNPVSKSRKWLEKAFDCANEAGDQVYACYAAYYLITDGFIQGRALTEVAADSRKYLAFLEKESQPLFNIALAFCRTIESTCDEDVGYAFDQARFLKDHHHIPVFMAGYDFGSLCSQFWSGQHTGLTSTARNTLISVTANLHGSLKVPETLFLSSMSFLLSHANKALDNWPELQALIHSNQQQLKLYTDNCTSNYLHKYLLINAELAVIDNQPLDAMDLYEAAIETAGESHVIHIEALANERYAHFWMSQNRSQIAAIYIKRAHYLYFHWGNRAKTQRLEEEYKELLENPAYPSFSSHDIADKHSTQNSEINDSVTCTNLDQRLDWLSALKASQAIMENIQSENLAHELIKIMAENAGASKAMLLLQEDDSLVVSAVYPEQGNKKCLQQPINRCHDFSFSKSLINYVKRIRSPQLVADVRAEQRFFPIEYLRNTKVQSAMAVPLSDAGTQVGLVYFENNQMAHAFTEERMGLVEMLGSQVITALRSSRLYEELRTSEQRFRDLIEGSIQGIVIHRDFKPLFINQAFAEMTGYQVDELMSMNSLLSLVPKSANDQLKRLDAIIAAGDKPPEHSDIEIETRDGCKLILDNMSRVIQWDNNSAIQSTLVDITSRREYEHQIEHMASHDALSHLPNRMLFQDRLHQSLAQCERHGTQGALLLLDLDSFKEVNDTLGHAIGDELIKGVARRLQAHIKDSDTVARLGGDEFAIILEDVGSADNIVVAAQRVLDSLSQPFSFEENEIYTSASIGITLYPEDSQDTEELVRFADMAMYSAKNNKGNQFHFFQQDMNLTLRRQKEISNEIRIALANDKFHLVFQPQINAKSLKVSGLEALIRWDHEGALMPPHEFLPIAEQNGLMPLIGEWALKNACLNALDWAHDDQPITLAVNVSAAQFHQSDLTACVQKVLQETQFPPERLELEITESLVMQNLESAVQTMNQLNQLGVKLSIDDFGTGYSSLSYLKRFPVHKIKIDRSFIKDLETDEDDAAIALAIIQLGHTLGMTVVAEGVESATQLKLLQKMGCDIIQGFYFSRPIALPDVERWISNTDITANNETVVI